jgi:hypothetical protein
LTPTGIPGPPPNIIYTFLHLKRRFYNIIETATFGVVILNNSPTKEPVDYTLRFSATFDTHNYVDGYTSSTCGTPGQRSGLVANFMETYLRRIPYLKEIEVPFSVYADAKTINLCSKFTDISLEIISTCEIPFQRLQIRCINIIIFLINRLEHKIYCTQIVDML